MLVTIVICINYNYMNLPLDFNVVYYLANRGICVAVGVSLYVFFEYFIFRKYYSNAILLLDTNKLDKCITQSVQKFLELSSLDLGVTAEEVNSCSEPLLSELNQIEETKQSASLGVSNQEQLFDRITYYENLMNRILYIYAKSGHNLISPFTNYSETSKACDLESIKFLMNISQKR